MITTGPIGSSSIAFCTGSVVVPLTSETMDSVCPVTRFTTLDADDMSELIVLFKDHYKKSLGEDFPQDPKKQLMEAVRAVFRSWDNPRANTYRRMNDIPHSWGTAVNVQSMVFGNMGETSGTGVAFTRNPATGEKKLYGEFLMNA